MKFYLIEAGGDWEWSDTQTEAKAKARQLKGTWKLIEVPTDKPGLLAFLSEWAGPPVEASEEPAESFERPAAPLTAEPQQQHITQSEVDALFTPKPQAADRKMGWADGLRATGTLVDTICDEIDKLDGHHLGNVATAVACRLKELVPKNN